jgi:hypothetical protein
VSDELRARFVPPWSTMAKDLLESTITTLVARRA